MDFRRALLEGNFEKVKEILSAFENTKENYEFLCDFHTECEVKGISLDRKIVKVIIDFVVEYRLMYSSEHEFPKSYKENLVERVKLLEEIVDDYLNCDNKNPTEDFVLLKCMARILKPIKNHKLKVPWQEVQVLICFYVAVKADRKRHQFKFIDDYFQLLVHEDMIRDVLQLVLNCLRENSSDEAKWKKLNNIYTILQMYYLLLKSADYYNIIDKNSVIRDKASNRSLQVIGECCHQMSKLRYEDFDDTVHPLCEARLFASDLSDLRNKLSHFQNLMSEKEKMVFAESNEDLLNIEKLGLFLLDMIQMVRNEIEKITLEDYKNMVEEGDVQKLFDRVKNVNFAKVAFPITNIETPSQYIDKEIYILTKCGSLDNLRYTLLSEISKQLKKSYHINSDESNSNVFHFIEWLKKNRQKPIDCIKNKLNAISEKSFIDIPALLRLFINLLPQSAKERNEKWFAKFKQLQEDFVTHPDHHFSPEDSIIEEFLEKIRAFIPKEDQNQFDEIDYNLMKKRSLKLEFEIYKDKQITSDWPKDNEKQKVTERTIGSYKDPLNIFVENLQTNVLDHKNIDMFLEAINWKNRKGIVDGVRQNVLKTLTKPLENIFYNFGKNEIVDEIYLLDCLEILKKMEIKLSQDYNYLDFDCSLPVARNLRNCLAHGDIYVDIFCPSLKEIVQSHLHIISQNYKDLKRIGFFRPDDFKQIKEDLKKHREWAREVREILNFHRNPRKLGNVETFKVRDHNNLSVVHYNLKNLDKENSLLMYLIEKLNQSTSFSTNESFEKILTESRITPNYRDINTVEDFIDKFLEGADRLERRRLLCIIFCFNSQNLDLFREVYSIEFKTTEFLHYAIAKNQLEILDFLLDQIKINDNLELIFEQAIKSDNLDFATKLIERISNDLSKHTIDWPRLIILAVEVGNIEVLELLCKTIKTLSPYYRNLLIKATINFSSNTNICKFVVENYLLSISEDESRLLLHTCCFNERYEMLKYLLEEVIPENHWDENRRSILISCFNNKSLEIVEYLIGKGAYFDYKALNDILPFFESAKVVKVLFHHFGILAIFHNPKKLTFVRNKNVAEVFHNHGYSLDWYDIASLPLEFILEKNPEKFCFTKLRFFLRRSPPRAITALVKYLKHHEIKCQFLLLPKFVTETAYRQMKWLKEFGWDEPTEDDFHVIIGEAIEKKFLTYVRIVLRRGSNFDKTKGMKKLALNAVFQKQEQILKLFQENGADLNVKENGMTYLDMAIELGEGTITDSMRLLSKYGVKCHYDIDFHNLNPQDMLYFGVLKENFDIIKEAHSLGAGINFKYEKFRFGTLLHITAYDIFERKVEIRNLLLKLGIDASITDSDNCTAFHLDPIHDPTAEIPKDHNKISPFNLFWAGVIRDDIDIIKEALDRGADVNSIFPGNRYVAALHLYGYDGSLRVVEFLLNKGANPLIKNYAQKIPIELTFTLDNVDVFELLYNDNKDLNTYFRLAVESNCAQIVKFLLEKGADVNIEINENARKYKQSAMEVACEEPDNEGLELAKVLIDYNIKVTKAHVTFAWNKGNYKLVKLLLYNVFKYPKTVQEFEIAIDKGLNINLAPDSDLRTYLHLACYFQDKEIVKYLLENGANFLQNDLTGKSPTTIALESNCELKKLLFKPILVKFYSMWSKYPSGEFIDFYNNNLGQDFEYIIVFWFDVILKVSGLFNNVNQISSPFELLAYGLWHNNLRLIEKAVDTGIEINHLLKELVFVGFVLNHNNNKINESLDLVRIHGGDVLKATANVNELASNLLDLAVPLPDKLEMQPYFRKAVESYKFKKYSKI